MNLSDLFVRGTLAERPTPGIGGRLYFVKSPKQIFYDNGTTWDDITPTIAAIASAIAYNNNVSGLSATTVQEAIDETVDLVSGAGTGSVTSVALTAPPFLSVAGTPITTSGTLAITLSGTALPIANGGTGGTNASAAKTALAAASSGAVTGTGITMATNKLLGRSTAATGAIEEITIGTNLTLAGGVLDASGSGTGAPDDATYITKTSNSTLTNEFALGSLATGLLKNTTTTGTPTIAAVGTDYVGPGATTSSGLTMATAKILGRTTASTGAIEEITIGTGLSLSAGTLTATGAGGSGDVVGPSGATANAIAIYDSITGKLIKDASGVTLLAGAYASSANDLTFTTSKTNGIVTFTPNGTGYFFSGAAAYNLSSFSFFNSFQYPFSKTDTTGRNAFGIVSNDASNPFGFAFTLTGNATAASRKARISTGAIGVDTQGDFELAANQLVFIVNNGNTTGATFKSSGVLQLNAYGAGTLTTDGSGNISATSDGRKKIVKGGFNRSLSAVCALQPVIFSWKDEEKLLGKEAGSYPGFIAQDVRDHIPEAVGCQPDGFLTLQDRGIIGALVNSVKELNSRLITLEK